MTQTPKAGTVQKGLHGKLLWLSPKPTRFGFSPDDPFGWAKSKDAACLEIDPVSRQGIIDYMVGAFAKWSGWFLISTFLYTGVQVISLIAAGQFVPFSIFIFMYGILWFPVAVLLAYVTYYHGIRVYLNERRWGYGILFHRQRREVLFPVASDYKATKKQQRRNRKNGPPPTHFLRIPWDEFHVSITRSTAISSHGPMSFGSMTLGGSDDKNFPNIAATADVELGHQAQGFMLWAYLYDFMEQGADSVPEPKDDSQQSAVAHYYELKKQITENIENANTDKEIDKGYWRDMIIARFLSFGPLPYKVVDWICKTPRAPWPEWVDEWRKPLPKEQWAPKPDDGSVTIISREQAEQLTAELI